jgi:hypothetical protein
MEARADSRKMPRRAKAFRYAAGIGASLAVAAPVAFAGSPEVVMSGPAVKPSGSAIHHPDRTKGARAGDRVKKWKSPKSYTTPYALVEVVHRGKHLERVPVSRCRGHYVDTKIDVLISTCGPRWHVRASYVSLSGKHEPFRIAYKPVKG